MTTFGEMKEFVRTQADADETDTPDVTLSAYARLAFDDICRRKHPWPHLEVTYTFTTVPGQNTYSITNLSGADMEFIESVVDDDSSGGRLLYAPASQLEDVYAGSTYTTDHGCHYTVVGDDLIIYPMPSTARMYKVRGFKRVTLFPSDDATPPDLPAMYHPAIQYYMLMLFYLSQEDSSTASYYQNLYEQHVGRLVKSDKATARTVRPVIMGGHSPYRMSETQWIRSMVEG